LILLSCDPRKVDGKMKVISLVTQKGGSGKSTLCVSLAVAAQEAGHAVCILEMDRQGTASQWSQARSGQAPEVAQVTADKLDGVIGRLQGASYDFIFIDTPGVDSPGTHSAIRQSDLCLIPCRPTPADLRSVSPTLAAIHRLEKDFAFVLSQTPTKGFRVRDTSKGLAVLGVLADVAVVSRTDHQDAVGAGQGVTEFAPEGQAAGEMRRLWAWIDNRTKGLPHVQAA
jgi:chromosome partitioning protein